MAGKILNFSINCPPLWIKKYDNMEVLRFIFPWYGLDGYWWRLIAEHTNLSQISLVLLTDTGRSRLHSSWNLPPGPKKTQTKNKTSGGSSHQVQTGILISCKICKTVKKSSFLQRIILSKLFSLWGGKSRIPSCVHTQSQSFQLQ